MEISKSLELLYDLKTDMSLYLELYGPLESVAILNKFDGFVFSRLQYCLIDRLFLGISKFMDPSKTGKYENLSLCNLKEKFNLETDPNIKSKYDEIVALYESANLHNYRNKIIGHNDSDASLGFEKVGVSITPIEAEKLLDRMIELVIEIGMERDSKIDVKPIEYESNGKQFLEKLSKSV